MELVHLLTRSGLTYTEISSKVYHDSFCQLGSNVSLPSVIYFETFYFFRSSLQIPVRPIDSSLLLDVQTCSGVHPVSYRIGTWVLSRE